MDVCVFRAFCVLGNAVFKKTSGKERRHFVVETMKVKFQFFISLFFSFHSVERIGLPKRHTSLVPLASDNFIFSFIVGLVFF